MIVVPWHENLLTEQLQKRNKIYACIHELLFSILDVKLLCNSVHIVRIRSCRHQLLQNPCVTFSIPPRNDNTVYTSKLPSSLSQPTPTCVLWTHVSLHYSNAWNWKRVVTLLDWWFLFQLSYTHKLQTDQRSKTSFFYNLIVRIISNTNVNHLFCVRETGNKNLSGLINMNFKTWTVDYGQDHIMHGLTGLVTTISN